MTKRTSKPRLALDRETVKTLVELREDKLKEVVGGNITGTTSSIVSQT